MNEIPEFARRIWEKEGPVCDCCRKKIPIEQVGDVHWWYELELHALVCSCPACWEEGRKPVGVGN